MLKMKTRAGLLEKEELGEWGIFISHSSDSSALVEQICEIMEEKGIPYLWDAQISVGSRNFSDEILGMIRKCIASVVVISEGFMESQWCNFEVGLLNGLNKNIYLFDPENLLSDENFRFQFDQFCPAYRDMESLTEAVRNEKLFYSLFNHETAHLTDEMFKRRVDEEVLPGRITLQIPGLSSIDPDSFQLKTLIINFGNYTKCRHTDKAICSQNMDDLDDEICEVSGVKCCMNFSPELSENPECVLLNHVWNKTSVDGDAVEIVMPIHKTRGTTFKVFFDAESGEVADALHRLLEPYGLMPSVSLSGTQNRVYVSLRSSAINGVFRLKDEFSNNFICPGVMRL